MSQFKILFSKKRFNILIKTGDLKSLLIYNQIQLVREKYPNSFIHFYLLDNQKKIIQSVKDTLQFNLSQGNLPNKVAIKMAHTGYLQEYHNCFWKKSEIFLSFHYNEEFGAIVSSNMGKEYSPPELKKIQSDLASIPKKLSVDQSTICDQSPPLDPLISTHEISLPIPDNKKNRSMSTLIVNTGIFSSAPDSNKLTANQATTQEVTSCISIT